MAAQPTPGHPAMMAAQLSSQAPPPPQPAEAATTAASQPSTNPNIDSLPLPAPIFTTPRLLVRPLHPQDAPSMAHHANDPLVTRYMSLSFPSPYTLSSASTWISMNATPPIYNWGICLRATPSTVIGGCGLKPGVDVQAHGAEIGFWIGQEFWGKGYMTEVLDGLVEWVFSACESAIAGPKADQRWTRVWAGVFAGNEGSARCFEKKGFVKEGVLRGAVEKGGVSSDLLVFGLLKGEWEERRREE